MSDFKDDKNLNGKDYDLDYFNSSKDKDVPDNGSLMPGDGFNEEIEFELDKFTEQSDEVNSETFDLPSIDDGDVELTSFGESKNDKKDGIKKSLSPETKAKIKKGLKIFGKAFVTVMLIGIITGCLVIGAFAIYVFNFVDDTVHENLDDMSLGFTTTIYAKDSATGEFVEYKRLHGEENRIWVDDENIPQTLKDAFIAVEDKRFMDHQGVDWKRTVAAFANMFLDFYSSNQGGSTITQQLVKNITGDNKQTPMRKIREIMRARYLEKHYYKDTILECYLNTISLGGGICGVEVAANYYFGKTTSELSLVECAAIASLAKEPERYRPDKNPVFNKERRATVLALMLEQKKIDKATYDEAIATELVVVADESVKSSNKVNSYFIDTLIEEVIDRLVDEYGMDEAYASKNFYNGGYKIYCTVDPKVQNILEEEYLKTDKYFTMKSKKTGKQVQSAMTIMDYSGHIVGIVGGAGQKTANRGLNRATMAYRQPGSTLKPIAAYSQAIQKNLINYSSILEDTPIPNYRLDGTEGPKNSYKSYLGNITAAEALERSTNTIPCKLIKKMGVESTYYYLSDNFGIDNLDNIEDMNLSSLGLGGTFKGINTTQSAAAFAVFGNLGTYYEPTTLTLMTDQHGTVILKEKGGNPAMDENTATVMNHMLQNVVYGANGTADEIASFSETIKCYAKTGTSSDVYDSWLAGGTPYYIGSCWFGFDSQEQLKSSKLAKTMWKAVMSRVHKDLEPKEFVDSEFVSHRYYCKATGLLATDLCTSVAEGWYKTNGPMPAACTEHSGTLLPEIVPPPAEGEIPEGGVVGENGNGNGSTPVDSSSTVSNTSSGATSSGSIISSVTSTAESSSTNSSSTVTQ